jgi:hypothetical protein
VDVKVIEGQLVEELTAEITGVHRRAYGEFVSPRGELASYALGWTTGADPHAGWVTVGIGAGNPGGGTFHAVVFERADGIAYALVDEAFAEVPEGGPHLSAEQARAHDTLPFVWWVVDQVMARDRRAWWQRHWLLGTQSIQTVEVFEQQEPVLSVSHGTDGVWQLIGASDANPATGTYGHLHHAVEEDPTLSEVLDLAPGGRATRDRPGGAWTRQS